VPILSWNLVTFGGEWRRERLEDSTVNRRGEAETIHRALFMQDEVSFGSDWSLVLGNRADHHEEYGWQHSPRAYLLHHWNDALTLKAGIGKGFKAPTLKQLSPEYRASAAAGRFTIVGSPDLEPETNTSYELGADYLGRGWSARATLFQNDLKNLIDTLCTQFCGVRGREIRTYRNIDEARIRGAEFGGGVDLLENLRLDVNLTLLDTEDRGTGQELAERPRQRGNATLSWRPAEGLLTRLRAEYVGRQTVYPTADAETLPSYTVWSLDIAQRLTDTVTLQGGIQNLTNTRLTDESTLFTYEEEGRLVWVGLNYSF
jgi:outer membrane receptor for ferrienterochelin and colicins